MFKKIIIIVIFTMLVLPATAFGDDGGYRWDDKNYLTINVIPKSKEIEIGEKFDFTLSLNNNTNEDIKLTWISNSISGRIFLDSEFDGNIHAGKRLELDISVEIPETLNWYKIDDDFYVDLSITLEYDVPYSVMGETYDGAQRTCNLPNNTTSLKITNLNDGSELLHMNVIEKETTFYFTQYWPFFESESHSYLGEYPSTLSNDITLINKSDTIIENLYVWGKPRISWDEDSLIEIKSNNSCQITVVNYYDLNPKDITNTLPAYYKASFIVDRKYYGVIQKKEYLTEILYIPNVEITLNPKVQGDYSLYSDTFDCIVSVKNLSSNPINNFILAINQDVLKKDVPFYNIKAYETIEIPLNYVPDGWYTDYNLGYVIGDHQYIWSLSEYIELDTIFRTSECENNRIQLIIMTGELDNVATPTPTISPTIEPTLSPTPTIKPTPTISPLPTATTSPTTTVATIQVTNIREKSSIPVWAFIILFIAIAENIILIGILRAKNKTKDEENELW